MRRTLPLTFGGGVNRFGLDATAGLAFTTAGLAFALAAAAFALAAAAAAASTFRLAALDAASWARLAASCFFWFFLYWAIRAACFFS